MQVFWRRPNASCCLQLQLSYFYSVFCARNEKLMINILILCFNARNRVECLKKCWRYHIFHARFRQCGLTLISVQFTLLHLFLRIRKTEIKVNLHGNECIFKYFIVVFCHVWLFCLRSVSQNQLSCCSDVARNPERISMLVTGVRYVSVFINNG